MAVVTIDRLCKRYDGAADLSVRNVSLTVADGEFMVLLGPSGCGKSSALRMIAGLEPITSGTIAIDGRPINHVPAKDRDRADDLHHADHPDLRLLLRHHDQGNDGRRRPLGTEEPGAIWRS